MTSLITETKRRVLEEAFGSIAGDYSQPKVLILDAFSLYILNATCRISELAAKYIPVVELLHKRRQPQPHMGAIYFLSPSDSSVSQMIDDMVGSSPMYQHAHIFFTTKPTELSLSMILENSALHGRIQTVKEINLEYLVTDSRSFVTDDPSALSSVFWPRNKEYGGEYTRCLALAASRISTLFASLNENPHIRYKSPSVPVKGAPKKPSFHEGAPCQLAGMIGSRIEKLCERVEGFPKAPTCELLIVDRSIDLVTPIAHDWSYRSCVHELLPITGNKFEYASSSARNGKPGSQIALLDESDPLWVQLRDKTLPKAYLLLSDLVDKIKDAQTRAKSTNEVTSKELRELIQILPDFLSQKPHIDNHVEMASLLSGRVSLEGLTDAGKLEQGLIFGDTEATRKGLVDWFKVYKGTSSEAKIRLLMLYGLCKPGKFDAATWQQISGLQKSDMDTIQCLSLLGAEISQSRSISRLTPKLKLNSVSKKKDGSKLERIGLRPKFRHTDKLDKLFRFYPYIRDLAEDLAEGTLDSEKFPALNSGNGQSPDAVSRRSKVSHSWAQLKPGGEGRPASGRGRKIILFVLGGMTHAEVRSIHWLSDFLNRDILIGSTSLDTTAVFLENLREMKM